MESFENKYNDVQLERILRENSEKKKAMNDSVGNSSVSYSNKKKGKINILPPLVLAGLLIAAGITAPKVIQKVEYSNDLEKATSIVKEVAYDNLSSNDLITFDQDGNICINPNNSTEDYAKLCDDDISAVELYTYGKALKDAGDTYSDEFQKLVTSSTYNDGAYNYISFKQYCTVNGFVDKDSNPSTMEFNKYAQDKLVESYRNNTIDEVMQKIVNESRGK